MEVLLPYVEFLDEFVEKSSSARTSHWIHGFHLSFLEELLLCHSILICTVSCYSSHGCMCKPCQCFTIFKCRSICYFSAPRLVTPDNHFVSNRWKKMKIFFFPLFLASSMLIPFFGGLGPSPGAVLLRAMLSMRRAAWQPQHSAEASERQ